MENLFEVRPGETFVYPEGVMIPAGQTFVSDDADDLRDVMREEMGRNTGSTLHHGYHDPAREEREFDSTDFLPAFYPRGNVDKRTLHRPIIINKHHPLITPPRGVQPRDVRRIRETIAQRAASTTNGRNGG